MTNDRELRERLSRIDPASGESTDPATSRNAQQLMEKIMQDQSSAKPRRTGWPAIATAAAVLLVVAGLAFAFTRDDSTPIAAPETTQVPEDVLELSLGVSDALASCIVPSAEVLADVELALAGTATSIDGEFVTLTVDRWYKGGDSETVRLFAQSGLEALIGTIEFEVGGTYLLSAYEGTVNYCGLSGRATPDLQALYDEAFPG